jgi:predicted acetyltransferase
VTDDISIDVPSEGDWDEFSRVLVDAFHEEPDPEVNEAERFSFEPERALMARQDGKIIGTAGIQTRRLSVPGAVMPAAHVTLVSVASTARRQGILTRFMERQFADARAAGESIATLWASEGRIYQRFGYGLAAMKMAINAESREVDLLVRSGGGRLREATPAELRSDILKLYDEAWPTRVGWSERREPHWQYRLADPKAWRDGTTALRAVVHEADGAIDGYALWRAKHHWSDGGPGGEVRVLETVTTTPDAYASLWQYLLTMDLTRSTTHWHLAIDEPLFYLVSDPRRLKGRVSDALWVRILDVPAALSARRYATDVDLVLEVADERIASNTGRWRLTGSRDGAACTSTVDDADLRVDIRALGAAYLGGAPLGALAAGGLVTELRPGAMARATAAFGWDRAPSSIEVF